MSYQVLARKWRPRRFREMVGQQHVLQALINALDHDRLHHAYLFTGTRGVGKTTIARILAKCLNCETGVSSEPCGQCPSCVEIAEGRFVDLIEVDAASRTKVEDTRELLENVQYSPTRGRYKVYLIDEVHMLSSHSFNALLKTLEEPPPHVKFLLATTDPQKLPVTILSRCLQFHLKNMEPQKIVDHLKFVLDKEMVEFEDNALWQLGRSADGSMRDAMSLTDQAIAFGRGKITASDVNAMLGAIDQSIVFELIDALKSHDAAGLMSAVERMSEFAPDYPAVLAELMSVLHRVAVGQALPDAVDNRGGDRERILALALEIPSETVQLFYQLALMGRKDLPMSPDLRIGFEMVLLRMLAFRPQGVHSVPTEPLPASQAPVSAAIDRTQDTDDRAQDTEQPTSNQRYEETPVEVSAEAESSPEQPVVAMEDVAQPVSESSTSNEPYDASGVQPVEPATVIPSPDSAQGRAASSLAAVHDAPVHTSVSPQASPVPVQSSNQAPESQRRGGLTPEQLNSMGLTSGRQVPQPPVAQTPVEQNQAVEEKAVPVVSESRVSLTDFAAQDWISVYAQLKVTGVLQSTVANCELVGKDGDRLMFILDESNASLFDESHQQRMADVLTDYFSEPVSVAISLGIVATETPAAFTIRLRQEKYDQTLLAMKNDPFVQQLIAQFDAVLDESSVKPADV